MTNGIDFTMAGEKPNRNQVGGVPVKAFFIPIVVILAALNIIIVVLMMSIFSQSAKLSQTMQDSNTYVSEATSLLAGTSQLSETSNTYVLMPVTSQGEPNVDPLASYASELAQTEHRGDQVLACFETYEVSEEVLQLIAEAAQSANTLVEIQNHALALTCSVYPPPAIPALEGLELPSLSAEEAALSDEERVKLAQNLVLDPSFGANRRTVSKNVNQVVGIIRGSSGEQAAHNSEMVMRLRTLIIVVSGVMVAFLAFAFFLLYRTLVSPLGKFSRLIHEDNHLDDSHGVREMRLLAGSYNALLNRRDTLETILREAAETDALTGLPNRYSFTQDLMDPEVGNDPIAVFMFDLDYLKRTNDTHGHAAGDDLIKRAANCISTCFAKTDDGRCYRIAGDEFAAIVKHLDKADIPVLVKHFDELQNQYNVSISWGYSYADDMSGTTLKDLLDLADQNMYNMKENLHRYGLHITGPLPEDES